MPDVLRVTALQVGNPVPFLILMKTDDSPLHYVAWRSSIYVERGGSLVKPNFS